MKDTEIEVLEDSVLIESLQMELKQANGLQNSATKSSPDVVDDISQLIFDMELSQVRLELKIAKKEGERLRCEAMKITDTFEKLKREVNEISVKEIEAQFEIAKLKSEVHREQSKAAAAESSEEKAKRENSALELANQHLALKAEEAKCELQILKAFTIRIDDTITEEERNACISVSVEDYESLVKKAVEGEMANRRIDALERELEIMRARAGEFRTRAEQAIWRAEVAEKAKALLEEERSKWIELEERRKVGFEGPRQESVSVKNSSFLRLKYHEPPKIYTPLGKLLKMKF
ncbi:hypothetical protein DCAR_0624740 [Daucus carota subsp. sativus]|uniref:Uncharacterized protein n=1 Tax=Daucus carota subsp. sativus TaxID=79200 RepID=A0A164W0U7_DAUCS|nr:hypothetical protein DCAR_0624740 [Daucus carota subsp. sativus]